MLVLDPKHCSHQRSCCFGISSLCWFRPSWKILLLVVGFMLGQVSPASFVMQAHKTGQNSIACVLAKWAEMRPQSHSRAPKISGLCGQGAAAEGTVTTCQIVGWLGVRLWEAGGFGSATSPPVKPVSLCMCSSGKVAICSKTYQDQLRHSSESSGLEVSWSESGFLQSIPAPQAGLQCST